MEAKDAPTTPATPLELLQALLRFDTTNPPGNEAACVEYVRGLLEAEGIPCEILASDPARPNLIARLTGRGEAPPLLLYGHVDVVPTAGQAWTHSPFTAEVHDGYVYGRGALDMKGGVAMLLWAFLRAKREEASLPGDVILTVLSDEEAGGDYGARFLCREHADRFAGVRHALGEFGGFSFRIGGRKFYPIQVAEKQICWLRATFSAPAGHASMPYSGGAMAALAELLSRLDGARLPLRVTPAARPFFEAVAANTPPPVSAAFAAALNPASAAQAFAAMGPMGGFLEGMLRNTINATVVHGGGKVNVIPAEVSVEMDARLLPGLTPEDIAEELGAVIGRPVRFGEEVPWNDKTRVRWEVVRHDPVPGHLDLDLFDRLATVLREADRDGIPVPMLLPAVTDGRHFASIGIQTYGFLPMDLPEGFDFLRTIHAADERLPVEAVAFGADAVYQAMMRR